MEQKNRILRITRTAVLIALLVVLQAALMPLNNSLITGSIVNLLLIISVMTCGLSSGLCVAAVSPVIARLSVYCGRKCSACGALAFHRKPQHRREKVQSPSGCAVHRCICQISGIVCGNRTDCHTCIFRPAGKTGGGHFKYVFNSAAITALTGGTFAFFLIPRLKKAIGGEKG